MLDRCTVRLKPTVTTDPDTFEDVATPGPVVYAGPCRIAEPTAQERAPEVAEAQWSTLRKVLHLPLTAEGVAVDHVVTVDGAALDPQLVGRTYRVLAPAASSQVTARRFPVLEVTR